MKKVGVITFHNSNNYGAVLQTLSVQKTIEKLGHQCEILNYICYNKRNWYKSFRLVKSPKGNIKQIINFSYVYKKNKKFEQFTDQNYKISEGKYFSIEELKSLNHRYNYFITGSDQVWNPFNTGFDKAYFLDFVDDNNKKISYAASFGVSNIPTQYHNELNRLLSNINNLSVREEVGKKIIESIAKKDAKVVLDPTLLVTKEEWIDFSKQNKNVKQKYILLYTVNKSKAACDYAEKLGKLMGLKVVKICSDALDYLGKYQTVIATPQEYVGLINNAEFIVTNSFHGAAFSINLNKNFYVFLGKGINSHSRMENLLNICNLNSRIINEDSEVKLIENINYNDVNTLLNNEREKSLEFLNNALK